jgi:hypothetical protein
VSTDWSGKRDFKQECREMATNFSRKQTALFLPADKALCVATAFRNKMIDSKSSLLLIERRIEIANKLKHVISHHKNAELYQCNLSSFIFPEKLDYAWLDLNGTITDDLAFWIQKELSQKVKSGSILCLTHAVGWRGNDWLKNTHDNMSEKHKKSYSLFKKQFGLVKIHHDHLIAFPAFLFSCLMRDWQVKVLEPFEYADTINMVFYRFKIERINKNVKLPNLLSKPKFTSISKKDLPMINSANVVDAIFKAKSPAQKASATKKLNAYVALRVSEGKVENQIRAGIAASVTKRKMAIKIKKNK